MKKDTSNLLEELNLCADFSTFYEENQDQLVSSSLPRLLEDLIKQKGLKKAHVFKRAELSEAYGYQIFSGFRAPERNKVLCLAVGMGLTAEETQALLRGAGYSTLYVKRPTDCVVLYGICHKLSVAEINTMLYEYHLETLG